VNAEDAHGNVDTNYNGDVTIALANNSGNLGGVTTVKAVNGVATFTDLILNNPGTGYTLQVSSGALTTDTSTTINVKAVPIPPQLKAGSQGASLLFTQKTNKKGKPTFIGFQFAYNAAMDPQSAGNPANYSVGTYVQVTKRVGRKSVRTLQLKPVGFSLSFSASTNTVKLILSGKQAFAKGGQVTLVAAPQAGIKSQQGTYLDGTGSGKGGVKAVFNISPKAKSITHA
jgi:hypothetical protein